MLPNHIHKYIFDKYFDSLSDSSKIILVYHCENCCDIIREVISKYSVLAEEKRN